MCVACTCVCKCVIMCGYMYTCVVGVWPKLGTLRWLFEYYYYKKQKRQDWDHKAYVYHAPSAIYCAVTH